MMPRACDRQVFFYRRCKIANGEDKCQEEAQNVLDICTTFALDGLRKKKINNLKFEAIDNEQYKAAMTVGPYNVGRTVANISTKTHIDGTADKLRPDTMWADDRYVDINQKEINEAKARIAQRKAAGKVERKP